jgi:hypothetical protein
MISAINPFTEAARGHRYSLTACWFVGGSLVGGALLGGIGVIGALLISLMSIPAVVVAAVGAAGSVVAIASDCSFAGFRLPNHPRQVNERWLGQYRRWCYAAGFGVQIGSGIATYIMSAAVYLTVLLGALSGSPGVALLLGLLFGAVRGSAVLLSAGATDPAALRRLHRRLDLLEPWSLRAAVLVEGVAAVVLGYLALGVTGVLAVAALMAGGACFGWLRRSPWSADDAGSVPVAPPVGSAPPQETAIAEGVR